MSQSFVYLPLRQAFDSSMTLVTRSRSGASVAIDLRRIIGSMDPTLVQASSTTLAQSVALGLVPQRLAGSIAAILGTFSLALVAAGLYTVACPGPLTAGHDISAADLVVASLEEVSLAGLDAALAGRDGRATSIGP